MNDLISALYIVVAILEIGILEYIIRQVDVDRLNNLDPPTVRWARRVTFAGGELFLCFSMYSIGWLWQPSMIVVGLISAGILILSVNIISLNGRRPPSNGHMTRDLPAGLSYVRSKLASLFTQH